MAKNYVVVSGVIFGLVATGQLFRAIEQIPVTLGGIAIPVWASWIAAVVAGGMCVWAFRSRG